MIILWQRAVVQRSLFGISILLVFDLNVLILFKSCTCFLGEACPGMYVNRLFGEFFYN